MLRPKLGAKLALTIFLPLLWQVVITIWLQEQLSQAECQEEKLENALKMSQATADLNRDIFVSWSNLSASTVVNSIKKAQYYYAYANSSAQLERDLNTLRRTISLNGDSPKRVQQFEEIQATYLGVRNLLLDLRDKMLASNNNTIPFERQASALSLRDRYRKLVDLTAVLTAQINSVDLVDSRAAARDARKQVKQISTLSVWLNVVFAILLFCYITRSISQRISQLQKNVDNLLIGRALTASISGDDEISQLDRKFRKMANEINRAVQAEQAIVTTAPDPIMTLSSAYRIEKANLAAITLWNTTEEAIIGKRFSELVSEECFSILNSSLDQARSESQGISIDTTIDANGEQKYINFSVSWSPEFSLYTCIIRDLSERKKAEELRDQVVAMISHDLRSPLNTIGFLCELLKNGKGGTLSSRGEGALKQAELSFRQMLGLVNDLLDLEKAAAGMMELQSENLAFRELLSLALAATEGGAKQANLTITVSNEELMLWCDRVKMERVLTNLIGNAISHSPTGAQISIAAIATGDFLKISIEDQGEGVPEKDKENIFKPYFQSVQTTSKRTKLLSSGLGLAICKAFIELHGGKITIESGVGGGSIFSFTIAKQPQAVNHS